MITIETENLKALTEKAKNAVEGLDEPLKTEAFKTILGKLLEEAEPKMKPQTIEQSQPELLEWEATDEFVNKICSRINRAKHPEIHKLKKALDLALCTLKIARDEAGADGLIPLQISKILSIAFREKVAAAAIGMALGKSSYVDRKQIVTRGGKAYKYILMHDGEKYLNEVLGGEENE